MNDLSKYHSLFAQSASGIGAAAMYRTTCTISPAILPAGIRRGQPDQKPSPAYDTLYLESHTLRCTNSSCNSPCASSKFHFGKGLHATGSPDKILFLNDSSSPRNLTQMQTDQRAALNLCEGRKQRLLAKAELRLQQIEGGGPVTPSLHHEHQPAAPETTAKSLAAHSKATSSGFPVIRDPVTPGLTLVWH